MTVLDSAFRIADSGFRVLDSEFQLSEFQIPKRAGFHFFSVGVRIPIISRIPGSKPQDFGFQKRKFRGFWNLDSLTWGDKTFRVKFRNTFCTRCFFIITLKIEEEKDLQHFD